MINKEADFCGLVFLGYGATISRTPLLNILVPGKNHPLAVLELVNCKGQLADSGGEYGTFVCRIFTEHMKTIYQDKSITDVVIFDGDSNVQLGGDTLKINYQKLD